MENVVEDRNRASSPVYLIFERRLKIRQNANRAWISRDRNRFNVASMTDLMMLLMRIESRVVKV